MTQFAKKTHPAREHLDATARRWPGLWAAADAVRAEHPQPPECYLTDFHGAHALLESLYATGAKDDFDSLQKLDPLGVLRLITPLTTMACWRMTQGIYRVDLAVYRALIDTPLTGDIPASVLVQLPEWCVYLETPGLQVCKRDGSGMAELIGVFARIDVESDGKRNLVLTLDMPEAHGLEAQSIPLRGQLDAALTEAMCAWQEADPEIIRQIRGYVDPVINLLLYICCSGYDIHGKRGQPGNPEPKRTRRDGWRLFPADGLRVWDVGVRMGAALRAAYHAEETGQGGQHGGVRGHIRRAHWHGFRSGKRINEDGTPIPAEKRQFHLKWLPPIAVNLDGVDEMPATIRRVP